MSVSREGVFFHVCFSLTCASAGSDAHTTYSLWPCSPLVVFLVCFFLIGDFIVDAILKCDFIRGPSPEIIVMVSWT